MSDIDPTRPSPAWRDRGLFPRVDNKSGDVRQKHKIYIHLDPGTRDLLYVGIAVDDVRPIEFKTRLPKHRQRLEALLTWGWRRDQIARIAWVGLPYHLAQRLEAELIQHLRPPFNVSRNPDASRSKGIVA